MSTREDTNSGRGSRTAMAQNMLGQCGRVTRCFRVGLSSGAMLNSDWFNPSMKQVWFEAFQNLSQVVDFDGIWLDINEPTSFTTGTQRNSTLSINETLLNPSSESVR